MELEAKIHEQLALRSRKRREELQRQASRYSYPQQTEALRNRDSPKRMGIREDLKTITARRGFLTGRLEVKTLTTLERWHVQLQLHEMDAKDGSEHQTSRVSADGEDVDPTATALEKTLRVLICDQPCFDVEYASAIRMGDLKETLFDASEQQLRASEALAFSSTRGGYTTRIVLFTLEGSSAIHARSSLFVPDLDARVQLISSEKGDAMTLIECLWNGDV